jgi:cytochrome bd ubiquinol oxidase subunit II
VDLATVWFVLIAVLWVGYFVLEGFDFGVGMLLPVLGRTDSERRVLINTIGPVWDGNEVWLLVAGGATFAAFPEWYATLFSGFYLPLFLILLALIVRGVAFEYRGKRDEGAWRAWWDAAIVIGSYVPALLWGVAFANIVRGVPIDRDFEYTGGFFTLLNPYALLGGVVTVSLFGLHGAVFLALKTTGDVRVRARAAALRIGVVAVFVAAGFLVWTQLAHGDGWTAVTGSAAALALVGGWVANLRGREGWAFTLTASTLALAVATLFLALYPAVMPSSTNEAFSLTVDNASSTDYTLTVMSWVALVMTPVVLAYQAWTFWVFRRRIGVELIPAAAPSVPAPRSGEDATAPAADTSAAERGAHSGDDDRAR